MTHYWLAAVFAALSFAILQLSTIGRQLMSTQEVVDALTAQVVKVRAEVVNARDALTAELDNVKAQLASAGVAEKVDLSGLSAAIQAVDDINPDPVPVVEEPVVDLSVEEPTQDEPPF